MGDSYAFTYDSNGRHKSTTYPGSVIESYTYDRDDRRTARCLVRGTTTLVHDTLTYDARGKTTTVETTPGVDETTYAYSGLGATVARSWSSSQGYQVDEYRADPHGRRGPLPAALELRFRVAETDLIPGARIRPGERTGTAAPDDLGTEGSDQ